MYFVVSTSLVVDICESRRRVWQVGHAHVYDQVGTCIFDVIEPEGGGGGGGAGIHLGL